MNTSQATLLTDAFFSHGFMIHCTIYSISTRWMDAGVYHELRSPRRLPGRISGDPSIFLSFAHHQYSTNGKGLPAKTLKKMSLCYLQRKKNQQNHTQHFTNFYSGDTTAAAVFFLGISTRTIHTFTFNNHKWFLYQFGSVGILPLPGPN